MRRSRALGTHEDLPIDGKKFAIGVSWDPGAEGSVVDLDLQGVAFDDQGALLDAAYYNNLKCLGSGMTHSGDQLTGSKQGLDEVIWVHFARLPPKVALLVFVVACHRGGRVSDAANGRFHILQDRFDNEVAHFTLGSAHERALLVGGLLKRPAGGGGGDVEEAGPWTFRVAGEVSAAGKHFIDILEPTIGGFVRSVLPGAPRRIRASFDMRKGGVVDLPRADGDAGAASHTVAGLGWDAALGEADLDVSAICLGPDGSEFDCVFFANQGIIGMRHSGDNLTGHGPGDAETITIDLDELSHQVQQVFFVINIYTPGRTFEQVANPYCRLITPEGEEFCRYRLDEAGSEKALIMARLFRDSREHRWGFQAVGTPCPGQTYKESLPSVMRLARQTPQDFLRSLPGGGPEESSSSWGMLEVVHRGDSCCLADTDERGDTCSSCVAM